MDRARERRESYRIRGPIRTFATCIRARTRYGRGVILKVSGILNKQKMRRSGRIRIPSARGQPWSDGTFTLHLHEQAPLKRRLDQPIAWRASDERLDIVDDLVGERLHRVGRRPGHVRRDDEIRNVIGEQRIALARRFLRKYVHTRA